MQNKDIDTQTKQFILILKRNTDLIKILDFLQDLNLPNYYIVAGSVFQTI